MTFSDSNMILKISNKFKHDSFIVFLPKDISITYLFTAWNQETLMHVKRKCASGPFWEKMNSEIFSYLEFHTQDEKARAEVRSFRQKHVFSLFEHFLDDLDDLISLFKCSNWSGAEKRGWKKGGRNGWKDQGLVQSIRSTKNWMSTLWHGSPTIIDNWKRIYGEKSLDDFFSWNIHFFLLIIDIVLSYILCDCAPQSIRGWRHGMLLIKSILSVIVFLQFKIKHKFMSWIEYWDDPL